VGSEEGGVRSEEWGVGSEPDHSHEKERLIRTYRMQRGARGALPLTLKEEGKLSRSRGSSSWWSLVMVLGVLLAASACTGQATEPVEEEPACILVPGPNGPADNPVCVMMK